MNALSASDAIDIEAAIKEGELETLRILVTVGSTHNHSFAVTKDEKAKYQELAAAQVEKCKQDHDQTFSKKVITSLDWVSLAAFAALTASSCIALSEAKFGSKAEKWILAPNDPKDPNKGHSFNIFAIGTALYGFGNALRSLKDLLKHSNDYHCKAKEALKKAQQIARLVDAIPVK